MSFTFSSYRSVKLTTASSVSLPDLRSSLISVTSAESEPFKSSRSRRCYRLWKFPAGVPGKRVSKDRELAPCTTTSCSLPKCHLRLGPTPELLIQSHCRLPSTDASQPDLKQRHL